MGQDLAQLASMCDGRVRGDDSVIINSVASLEAAAPDQVSYLQTRSHAPYLNTTSAGAVLLTQEDAEKYSGNVIIVTNPRLAFAIVAQALHPRPGFESSVHETARIAPDVKISESACVGPNAVIERGAEIGDRSYVGAGVFIGEDVSVGKRTVILENVTIHKDCTLGDDCIIHSGVVIGGDGFGYERDQEDRWIRIPQIGRTIICDRVEVGSNTTIDRGALGDTVIHDGVKVDNLVMIAHNVIVGENTIIAACAGIAGSAVIGKRCQIGGQAGIFGHIELCDDVVVAGKSMVAKSINKPGTYASSIRTSEARKWQRNEARIHQLDEITRRLARLEKEIKK